MKDREDLPPILKNRERKPPFEVPAGYFETFNEELKNKLEKEKELQAAGSRRESRVRRLRIVLVATAAAIALIVALRFNQFANVDENKEFTNEEIITYVNNNSEEFDEYLLLEFIKKENIEIELDIGMEGLKGDIGDEGYQPIW